MSNPDDDTVVPSGLNDDARMERTSPPPSHKGTSERSKSRGKGKGKDKGKAAEVPRQGSSEAARWADALEAGDYSCTGPEEDLAERFTRSLLEDACWGD